MTPYGPDRGEAATGPSGFLALLLRPPVQEPLRPLVSVS